MSRTSRCKSMIQFIDFELMLLKDYVKYVEEYFMSQGNEIDKKWGELQSLAIDDPIREPLDNYHQSYHDVLADNLIDDNFYVEEFTQRFRYSLVIQTYSFAEKYLSKITDHFTKKNNIAKINSRYIQNLAKLVGTVDIRKCEYYNFMIFFTDLRNCIVHSEGVFYSDCENVKRVNGLKELKKQKLIDFKETVGVNKTRYKIIIDEKLFIAKSINKIEHFLHEIDELLQTQY